MNLSENPDQCMGIEEGQNHKDKDSKTDLDPTDDL
jgi:hypothetical protein